MKIITYIYVFALYILFSPGFFVTSKMNLFTYIVHGFCFTIFLYVTFDLVNSNKELFEQATLSINGIDHLVNLIDSHKQQNETNIDIQNKIQGDDDSNRKCWNALGKTQKDLETLRIQLDSYDGSKETIEKLDAMVNDYKNKIITLENQKEAYKGDRNSHNKLTKQFNMYKDQIESLGKQLLAFDDNMEDTLNDLNTELGRLKSKETELIYELKETRRNKGQIVDMERRIKPYDDIYQRNIGILRPLRNEIANKSYC